MKKTVLIMIVVFATTMTFAQQDTHIDSMIIENAHAYVDSMESRFIDKINNQYYIHEGDSITIMNHKEYLKYIDLNCPEAMSYYRKGCQLRGAGIGLLVTGIAATAAGFPLYMIGLIDSNIDSYWGGYACIMVGSLAVSGSIPLLVVGSIKRNNSHKAYNKYCCENNDMTVSLQTSQDGLGIAFSF